MKDFFAQRFSYTKEQRELIESQKTQGSIRILKKLGYKKDMSHSLLLDRKRYRLRKAQGLCTKCGIRKPSRNRLVCLKCHKIKKAALAKIIKNSPGYFRKARAKWVRKNRRKVRKYELTYRPRKRELEQKKRKERIKLGLCAVCGKTNKTKFKRCPECLKNKAIVLAVWRAKKKQDAADFMARIDEKIKLALAKEFNVES